MNQPFGHSLRIPTGEPRPAFVSPEPAVFYANRASIEARRSAALAEKEKRRQRVAQAVTAGASSVARPAEQKWGSNSSVKGRARRVAA
jgi:hypothetical protein